MMIEATATRNAQSRLVPPASAAQAATWLLCRFGTVRGALPLEPVVEIMRPRPFTQVAGAPPYVLGLSIIRGAPVPVVDIGRIVTGTPSRAARVITVRSATGIVALAVDEVIGLATFAEDICGRLPALLQDAAAETIAGVAALDAELIVVLRTGRLLPDHVLAMLDAARAPS
jgi:purine-binding chemotaxis protein CheW